MPDKIEHELQHARAAQAEGNPGKARVGARRAAGWVVREYYQRVDGPHWGGDALTQLKRLRDDESMPEQVRAAATRLTTKVDHDHKLPFDNDPVDDARGIVAWARLQLHDSPHTPSTTRNQG